MPYFTAGFPDLETTRQLIVRADEVGTAVVEVGFPFTDSIADGPQIQRSFYDALRTQLRVADICRMVAEVRPTVQCGLAAMLSFSIVRKLGGAAFLAQLQEAGFDGVIIPDVALPELRELVDESHIDGLCTVGLVAPTTSTSRCAAIAAQSSGFVYQVAAMGTTGERSSISTDVGALTEALRAVTDLPVCVGFGISTPAQVQEVCRVADGAIVGSAVLHEIRNAVAERADARSIVDRVGAFLSELARAAACARAE